MKNALLECLERSYKTAQRQQKNGWQSDDAPNILVDGLNDAQIYQATELVREFAESKGISIVEFDEYDFSIDRVSSRALFSEIQEAPTPVILVIGHYGVAEGDAREFVRSIVKNKLYPATNLWQQTVLDRLLFTVALGDKEQTWRSRTDIGESSCFSLYSAQEVNSEDKLWLRVGESAFHFGNANTLIHGTAGAGKSHLLRNLLLELHEKADKDWYLNVAFCDTKGEGANYHFDDRPHLKKYYCDLNDTKELIHKLFYEIDARIEDRENTAPGGSFAEYEACKYYNPEQKRFPREVLLIDELFELLDDAEAMNHLMALAMIAPKIGIHLIIATQYSPAKLHEAFLALMRNRIVLRCNEDASLALLGNLDATTLARGQYILCQK